MRLSWHRSVWLGVVAVAACDASTPSGMPDLGVAVRAPLRSCATTITWKGGGTTVGVGGEWNHFDPTQTPMMKDSSGAFSASVTLPPGSYGYKIVADGNWQLDPDNPYSKYIDGTENSVLEVDDCRVPQLVFKALTKSAQGALKLDVQYLDGSGGAGMGPLAVKLDGQTAEGVSVDADALITVAAAGLAKDKHRVSLTATDKLGNQSAPLEVPFWIEDRPFDFRDGLLYFAFTDRFRNGDPSNDSQVPSVDARANYGGGDFAGIKAAIDDGYFDSLGVRSLWVSPPNPNPEHFELGTDGRNYSGYHGYWPIGGGAVEKRFGSLDDFRALVKAAHQHGIRVIVDAVLNHVHKEHPFYQQHQSDGWFNGDGTCVCGGTNCDWTTHALDCWFTNYLPDLDYHNFDAMKAMIDDALFWARDIDVDGFRVDAVKHFLHAATKRLRAKLHDDFEHADTLYYLIGETFDGDRGLINSFIGPSELLAQFDFPLYFAVRDSFGGGQTLRNVEAAAKASDAAFGTAPMSPFAGNHDVPRFVTIADNAVVGDGKDQAWNAPPGAPATEAPYQKLRLALIYVMTQPGVPLLYYGDEIGMPGTADPDNRRMMRWSGYSPFEQATLDVAKKAGQARAALPALERGTRTTLWIDDDLYVYARVFGQQAAVVAINRAQQARTASVPIPSGVPISDGAMLTDHLGGAPVTISGGQLPLSLGPVSATIWAP